MTNDTVYEMPLDLAGLLLAEVSSVLSRLEEAEINERKENAPLPRGALTCGEIMRFLPVLSLLIIHRYPRLVEPGVMEEIMRNAATQAAGPTLN